MKLLAVLVLLWNREIKLIRFLIDLSDCITFVTIFQLRLMRNDFFISFFSNKIYMLALSKLQNFIALKFQLLLRKNPGIIQFQKLLCGVFLILLSISCGSNKFALKDVNFGEEIQLVQNLEFEFNHEVPNIPKDGTGIWELTEYIKFTPSVKGGFRWLTNNKLVFSPSDGFRPATLYKAELTDVLEKKSDKSIENESIQFHTPYLQLIKTNLFWGTSTRPDIEGVAKARLIFNYRVNPSLLSQKMSITSDDKKIAFHITQVTPDHEIMVEMPSVAINEKSDEEIKITFHLDKSLTSEDSPTSMIENQIFISDMPSPDRLKILDLETSIRINPTQGMNENMENGAGASFDATARIFTSHTVVDIDNLKNLLKIKNSSDWEYTTFDAYNVIPAEDGFILSGSFMPGKSYDLTIDPLVKGIIGKNLEESVVKTLEFQITGQSLVFASKRGIYLRGKGSKEIGVRISNFENVEVKISKIYENNILHFLRANGGYSYNYDSGESSDQEYSGIDLGSYGISDLESYGTLLSKKTYLVNSLPQNQGVNILNMNFEDSLFNYPGAYLIEVIADNSYYSRAAKLISITDIGLTVKRGIKTNHVFAHSLETAEPIQDADISVISKNNQTIMELKTDRNGMISWNNMDENGFEPKMIIAKNTDDFNFLAFDYTRVPTSRFDIGGATVRDRSYNAYINMERQVYRPGETIHFNAIIRDIEWKIPNEMPVIYKINYPDGNIFQNATVDVPKSGIIEIDYTIPVNAPTGEYKITIYSGDERQIGDGSVMVEEFMPEKIKVNLNSEIKKQDASTLVETSVSAAYFHGTLAGNRNYEVEWQLKPKPFVAPKYPGYIFNITGIPEFSSINRKGKLDAQGKSLEKFILEKKVHDLGILESKTFVTVFDESARPIHRVSKIDVPTQSAFFGIKSFDKFVSTQSPVQIPIIALNYNQQPLSNVYARIKIIKINYETVMKNYYGRIRYVSLKSESIANDQTISVGNNSSFSFIPKESGEYQVRVSKPGVDTYVAFDFYAYGYGSTSNNSFEVNTDGQIDIVPTKKEYKTGDEVKVLFKTPFNGRLLVTVERDDLQDIFQIETEKNAASLSFDLKKSAVPNVFISATLIRPMSDNMVPFTTAHGYHSIRVFGAEELPVTVTVPKECRSRTKQIIQIQTEPQAYVTIAAVDEGILQIRDAEDRNPNNFFYAKRALEVNSYDVYTYLFPEHRGNLAMLRSKTGGAEFKLAEGGMNRQNPLSNKRVKPVSFWSGVLRADASGRISFPVTIPQFSGSLRIMAVASKENRFGYGTKNMIVVDPIVINTPLPRFLSPNDSILVPVTIMNTTNSAVPVQAKINVSKLLNLNGIKTASANISPKGEAVFLFNVSATKAIGEAVITLTVSALGENFTETNDITIRPGVPLQKKSESDLISGGKSKMFDLSNQDFIPSTSKFRITIGRSPLVQVSDKLIDLVQYPHGCLEQTISTAFPQMYLTEFINQLKIKSEKTQISPVKNVQAAIDKIRGLQHYSGGFLYWPGDYNADPWVSVYACHFLTEAIQSNTYRIKSDDGFYTNSLEYVRQVASGQYGLMQAGVNEYNGEPATQGSNDYISGDLYRLRAYACYVLSTAGERPISSMNVLRTKNNLPADARVLLACAYLSSGDENAYQMIMPGSFADRKYPRQTGIIFSSPIRDEAMALNALITANPNNSSVGAMTKRLSHAMRENKNLNTQELAFGLLALGKVARMTLKSSAVATITIDGKNVVNSTEKEFTYEMNGIPNNVKITTQGVGNLYYNWEISGVSESSNFTEEDQLISVRKTLLSRSGSPAGNTFNVNDLVVVKITLKALRPISVKNVVITDILPAGFEIENPRITSQPELVWIKDNSKADHTDYRDDRIHFFTNVEGDVKNFYYVCRAVTSGKFSSGVLSADAMYNGDIRSYTPGNMIRIMR